MVSPSMLALRTGKALSASTVALMTNGMYVSRMPLRSSYRTRCAWRSWSTRVMSISKTVVTWAEVRFESTMCSAVFLRIGDMGTISTREPGPEGAGPAAGADDGDAGGGAAGALGRAGAAGAGAGRG